MADLTATQQMTLTVEITDKKGNPAAVDGVPEWATSDETVFTLMVAEDGLSAELIAGAPGTARVTFNADADLGDGVKPIIGEATYEVSAGEATIVKINAGTPTEQA